MRRVAIIQARMGSTRLPGKVLMDLAGRPMLARQLERVKRCRLLDDVVVATTTAGADDALVALARDEGVRWFRGSESDVLGRYAGAASEAGADVVVRITADCPLLDPETSDRVIAALSDGPDLADYASNVLRRTYPVGLDTEALWRDTLERTARHARSASAREHVTPYVYAERPDLFLIRSVTDETDASALRWTVDVPADLERVRRMYADLGLAERSLPYREMLRYACADAVGSAAARRA
jgi:spore coat polysaccharide biosynthesis protein SpsF